MATAPRSDRKVGLSIVAVAFLAALTISWWAQREAMPPESVPPAPPTTVGVEGFPKAVDPIRTLAAARDVTDREELVGIALTGVRSDGTVDVTQPGSALRYVFQSERGEGPQPPRPKGTLPSRRYCGRQTVRVDARGLSAEPDNAATPCHDMPRPLPEPRCGPREIWPAAEARGIPTDRAATIEYYRARTGPAWRFEIPGTAHRFTLYGDCGRELTALEANGHVP